MSIAMSKHSNPIVDDYRITVFVHGYGYINNHHLFLSFAFVRFQSGVENGRKVGMCGGGGGGSGHDGS